MAPKLPPPAITKAVLEGPAWSDTDKVLLRSRCRRVEVTRRSGGVIAADRQAAPSTLVVGIRHSGAGVSANPESRHEMPRDSALDERLLNDKMAGLALAAFEKTMRFKHLAQVFEH